MPDFARLPDVWRESIRNLKSVVDLDGLYLRSKGIQPNRHNTSASSRNPKTKKHKNLSRVVMKGSMLKVEIKLGWWKD